MAWIAVRCDDAEAVVRALGLRTVLPCNWRSGLDEIAAGAVFVTPPLQGWVLAIGCAFAVQESMPDVPAPIEGLRRQFAEFVWFATDDKEELHGWALQRRGELVRAFAHAGHAGTVLWHGEVTDAERALSCFVDDPRDLSDDDVKWWPDSRIVTALAAAWSLSPVALAAVPRASSGWTGRL